MEGHLQSKARYNGFDWPLVFVASLWTIWVNRNWLVFNEGINIPHVLELKRNIMSLAGSFVLAWGKSFDGGVIKLAKNIMVKWEKPEIGTKLNIDGSFFKARHLAGIGGILRDKYGSCVSGFMGPCEFASPFISELFALHYSLRWACNNGYIEMVIETDSEELHALVKGGGSSTRYELDSGKLHALVKGGGSLGSRYVSIAKECCALLCEFPNIELAYVYREANYCADRLAREGALHHSQTVVFKEPPDYLWKMIFT